MGNAGGAMGGRTAKQSCWAVEGGGMMDGTMSSELDKVIFGLQSSLQLDLDSFSTQLHCIALPDAGSHLLLKIVLGAGEGKCGAKNLPGLVPRNPDSPLTQNVVHWLKGGEWELLNYCY
jgi:hypothetical protein